MNPNAAKLADDQFYKTHPELIDPITSKRRPLSMEPKDAKLRAEWMISYKAADDAEKNGFSTCEVGGVLAPCPMTAPILPPPPAPPPAPSISCKVEVRANKLSPLGYYHMFIVFTDGTGKEFYLRGGPSPSAPIGSSASTKEISGGSSHVGSVGSSKSIGGTSGLSDSSGSSHASGSNPSASSDSSGGGVGGPYGYIITEYGEYVPGTIDWDPAAKATTVESGTSSCSRYVELQAIMDKIADSKTRYNPMGPNSNSAVFTALKNIGITPKAPNDVWTPGAEIKIYTK